MEKYKNVLIENTPTDKFPTLVTITKTPKNKAEFLGKKYITRDKAVIAIDAYIAEGLIAKGGTKVKEELQELFGMEVEG